MTRCSPQAQGTGQPLDGDLEAHPGPDGQRDQEPVERNAEPQGRGAGGLGLGLGLGFRV